MVEPDWMLDQRADSQLEILLACELLEAIDELEERLRTVFIHYKILGFNTREVAAQLGIDETTVSARASAAAEQIQKKIARNEARDRRKMGALIAPATMEIRPEFRAAFCAIWEAEGRLPHFDDRKYWPLLPPPWWSVSVVPAMQTAAEAVVSSARLVVLTILLLFVPLSLIALYYVCDPIGAGTARAGLYVPPTSEIGEINDVVDAYPAAQAPSRRASTPKAAPKASPALDADALQELDGPGFARSSGF